MRILCLSAQKPDSTGSGVYLTQTVKGFVASGHEVAVIAGIDRDDAPTLPEGVAFRPVRFRTPDLPFPVAGMSDEMPYLATRYRDFTSDMVDRFKRAFSAALDDVMPAFQPDLVVCHHLYLVTALVAHRGAPCPIVAISHSTDLRQMRSHDLERSYIIEGVRRLDGVCALHGAQAQAIREVYGVPASKVTIVGTGYDDQVFRPVSASRAPKDGIRVAYAGKISRKKGLEPLLRCLDRLPWAPEEFSLRLAGGFARQDEYDRIRALGAAARYRVEFLGKLSQQELARVYQSSDVFVLPSFYEGLPLVVIEALACGCAVVVSDLPGVREWLDGELPGAPIVYVQTPRMIGADEPVPEDLPDFERRLADALVKATALPTGSLSAESVGRLSWRHVAERIVHAV